MKSFIFAKDSKLQYDMTRSSRKILPIVFLLPFLVLSSCGGGGKKDVEIVQEFIKTDDSITAEVVIDSIDDVDTLVVEQEKPKEGPTTKSVTFKLYEVEFYPPSLKEAYEAYMLKSNDMEDAKKHRYHFMDIWGEEFIFNNYDCFTVFGDYKGSAIIGYTIFNGVETLVEIGTKEDFPHVKATDRSPRTFTIEYLSYPENWNELFYFNEPFPIYGSLDMENIPKIGEELPPADSIKYVFYKSYKDLKDERREREQRKQASEAKDTLAVADCVK